MQRCLLCGGDANEPYHERRCRERQGFLPFRSYFYPDYPHNWSRDAPAFVGLSEALKDVICDIEISDDMVWHLWVVLDDGQKHFVRDVIKELRSRPWFDPNWSRSSRERFVR